MDFYLDNLFDLPNVVADSYSNTLEAVIVKLRLFTDGINYPNCNEYTCKFHQVRPILVRDLSIFGKSVYLKIPRRQFYYSNCKTSPTEPFTWLNKRQRQTNGYQEYIYERVKELTVKQVSENEKMCVAGHPRRSEDAIQDIFHKVASCKKTGDIQKLVNKALNKIRLILKLKGSKNRCLLMNNQANLTTEDRQELELLKSSPSLKIAYELKEELITIYNSDITASGGIRKIKKRMQSR